MNRKVTMYYTIKLYKKLIIPYVVLLVIILVDINFWGIFTWSGFMKNILYENRSKWIAILAIILALLYSNSNKKLFSYINKYLIALCISVCIMWIYALVKYQDQRFITTYGRGAHYLFLFLIIPLLYIVYSEQSLDGIMGFTNAVTIIMYVVILFVSLFYECFGKLLFSYATTEVITRNGKLYIGAGPFAGIITIYNLYILLFNKKENSHRTFWAAIEVFLFIANFLFVEQSRVYEVVMLFSIGILLFYSTQNLKHKILMIFFILFGIGLYYYFGIIDNFIQTFNVVGENSGSTLARMGGYKYYFNQFIKNPIFGIGFAGENEYYNLVHGNGDFILRGKIVRYRYSDVGIAGLLAQTGIFSIIIYVIPIVRMIFITGKIKRNGERKVFGFLCSMLGYLLISSLTLIITDQERILAYPLIIVIFEYFNYNFQHKSFTTSNNSSI